MDTTKIFSESNAVQEMYGDQDFLRNLKATSVGDLDAAQRQKVYADVMSNYEELKDTMRSFSGYDQIDIKSNQYFNATMSGNVRSFSGFLSIERACSEPTSLLWYNDVLGVTDNRTVMPNIGKENFDGINSKFSTNAPLVVGTTLYTISTNKKLIKGSVELRFLPVSNPQAPITIKDDGKGTLLAPAGVLAPNTSGNPNINYATGVITFTVGTGYTIQAGDVYTLIGNEDIAGDPTFGKLNGPGNNRFTIDQKNIVVTTEPDMLVGERNLMTMAASMKSLGYSMAEALSLKLTELYTKLINKKQVNEIMDNWKGNAVVIPMATYKTQFNDYASRLDALSGDLINIDTQLAYNTTKAVKATSYVVGRKVGDYFRKLRSVGIWTDNIGDSSYVSDLIGYISGVPVLRHTDVADNEGYAVHKTPGGEMAPLMRGIYLPLTWTPSIGNYNNPTQVADAVFYQESNKCIFPELIQKFVIND